MPLLGQSVLFDPDSGAVSAARKCPDCGTWVSFDPSKVDGDTRMFAHRSLSCPLWVVR